MLTPEELKDVHDVVISHLGLNLSESDFERFFREHDKHFNLMDDIKAWGANDTEVRQFICQRFYDVLVGLGYHPQKEKGVVKKETGVEEEFWVVFNAGAIAMNMKVEW